ncbi:MAG TPA: IclR family transcriptional regulator [bacterium]|nr:IclR family transcriptional regulator [bacterium]
MARIVPAVARALDILEAFLGDGGPWAVPDLAARLALPRSSVHELVRTLLARGYLHAREDHPNEFVLGLRVFELGSTYAAGLDLPREGHQAARAVSAACNETVHVAVLDHTEVVYIAKVDSTQTVRMVSAVGRRLPAHCTAVGKMLLAGLADHAVVARYAGAKHLPAMTPNSIARLAHLRRELVVIRARGVAFDDCESNADVRCVAAPVFDREGQTIAAISISAPVMRMQPRRRAELAALVKRGAEDLSRRLGARPRPHPPVTKTGGWG